MAVFFSKQTELLMQTLFSRFPEKDRRHYAALESLKLGRGGVSYICKVLGIHKNTIIQGRKELTGLVDKLPIDSNQQRLKGGGRKKNFKTARNNSVS
jgi:hypothetical protein